MGNTIKGLTLEIGGNVTPLNKALGEVNAVSKDLQNELKSVEKLLKLDPTNTELLAQKQKILADSVNTTSEKLKTLKTAAEQAAEKLAKGEIGADQFRALQREIVTTEQKLESLEKQAIKANAVLSKDDAIKNLKKIGTAVVAIGAAAVTTGAASVKLATDFEDGMAAVSTIADTAKMSVEDLSKGAIEVSNETGIAATEISNSLYQAISAGADTAKALDLVEVAAKTAKGGFTDTATAVDGLTSVLNTYGMATADAEGLANKFIITQNLGKTTVGELAESIGNVAPTAAAAGVSVDELLSSVASLTANGIKTSAAMSGTKAALSNIIKPTAEAAALAEELGINFSSSALKSKGWTAFLEEVKTKTGGNTDQMAKLFGSVEALNTVLTLTSDQGTSLLNNSLAQMKSNTTAVDDAFNKVSGTSAEQFKNSLNELKNFGIELGTLLLPVLTAIAKTLKELPRWLKENSDKLTILGIIIGTITALVIAFNIQQALMASGLTLYGAIAGVATTVTTALGTAFTFLTGPIGLIILAIGALIAVGVLLYKHWDEVKATAEKVWNAIGAFFTETIPQIVNNIVGFFAALPGKIAKFFTDIINGFLTWRNNVDLWIRENVSALVNTIVNFFAELPKKLVEIGSNMIKGLWEGIQATAKWIKDKVSSFVSSIKSLFTGKDGFDTHSPSKWGEKLGTNITDGVGNTLFSGLRNIVNEVGSAVGDVKSAFDPLNSLEGNLNYALTDASDLVPTAAQSSTSDTIGAAIAAGLAAIGDVIYDAIPKTSTFNVNGEKLAETTWGDFETTAANKNKIFAASREAIASIARSVT